MSGVMPANFSKLQQISQNVARISQTNRASSQQTVRALEVINNKSDQATTEVINNALEMRNVATGAKGKIVDLMA